MEQLTEKKVIRVSIWSAISVIIAVSLAVWNVSGIKAEFISTSTELNNKIIILQNRSETQQQYLYDLKSDLKGEIEKNNKKLNDIYNLLIRG